MPDNNSKVPVPSWVPEHYQAGYMPGDTVKQMQDSAPGHQHKLDVAPLDTLQIDGKEYRPANKLLSKHALITGGDSGIGRSTAILFLLEGCSKVLIHYVKEEKKDADALKEYLNEKGLGGDERVGWVEADLGVEEEAGKVAEEAKRFLEGRVDILFNNAATQNEVESILDLSSTQWDRVNKVNIYGIFWLTKAIIPMMPWGSSICLNSSINPFVGHPKLLDYTTTKGAIVAFMRSLSNQIVQSKGIRVNCVNPGPIWTPLVVATMGEESMKSFGPSTAIGRAGQPIEVATCVVFLSSPDASYVTAQCLHCNGGTPF